MTLSPAAVEAHAAWKAARETARAAHSKQPACSLDPDRTKFFAEYDRIKAEAGAAERAASAAFKAMANALPKAGALEFISPRDWLANQEHWRDEWAAVKVWNDAPHWNGWYTCLARYEVDTRTGERVLRSTEMRDDCVDEAARRNESWAAYYEAKRTGDWKTYYAKYPPRAA